MIDWSTLLTPEAVLLVVALWGFAEVKLRQVSGGRKPDELHLHAPRTRGKVFRNPSRVLHGAFEGVSRHVSFERFGHAVVVRTPSATFDCAAFAESFSPPVYVVLRDTQGILGELRTPLLECLWMDKPKALDAARKLTQLVASKGARTRLLATEGIAWCPADAQKRVSSTTKTPEITPTFTSIVEGGTRYCFDVCKVMFASGNTTERMHFGTSVKATGEVVVDMFSGIGYFSLPLLRSADSPQLIVALEKNPVSAALLFFNASVNGVSDRIAILCGDNRMVGDSMIERCDRVIMGYLPDCREFLPRAVRFLKVLSTGRPRGIVHYHFLSPSTKGASDVALEHVREALSDTVASAVTVVALRVVKSYAPKKWHCVADLHFDG